MLLPSNVTGESARGGDRNASDASGTHTSTSPAEHSKAGGNIDLQETGISETPITSATGTQLDVPVDPMHELDQGRLHAAGEPLDSMDGMDPLNRTAIG